MHVLSLLRAEGFNGYMWLTLQATTSPELSDPNVPFRKSTDSNASFRKSRDSERERERLSSEEKEIELKGGRGGQDSKSSKVLPTNNQIYLTLPPPSWGNDGGMGWGGAGTN